MIGLWFAGTHTDRLLIDHDGFFDAGGVRSLWLVLCATALGKQRPE